MLKEISMNLVLLFCGAYFICFALAVNTRNFTSMMAFKIIPFLAGIATVACAAELYGWINIFI